MPPHCAEDYPAYLTITNGFTADTVDASPLSAVDFFAFFGLFCGYSSLS